jgi:hypothetical protein
MMISSFGDVPRGAAENPENFGLVWDNWLVISSGGWFSLSGIPMMLVLFDLDPTRTKGGDYAKDDLAHSDDVCDGARRAGF